MSKLKLFFSKIIIIVVQIGTKNKFFFLVHFSFLCVSRCFSVRLAVCVCPGASVSSRRWRWRSRSPPACPGWCWWCVWRWSSSGPSCCRWCPPWWWCLWETWLLGCTCSREGGGGRGIVSITAANRNSVITGAERRNVISSWSAAWERRFLCSGVSLLVTCWLLIINVLLLENWSQDFESKLHVERTFNIKIKHYYKKNPKRLTFQITSTVRRWCEKLFCSFSANDFKGNMKTYVRDFRSF